MLGIIVFSKNRAMQLQALLDSIEINTRGFFNSIDVIYVASDSEYQKGYDLLAKRKPYVGLHKQDRDVRDMTIDLIKHEYVVLAADDDIFYRPVGKNWMGQMAEGIECFSLRHGLNINYCYPLNKDNPIEGYDDRGEFIVWNWRNQKYDWNYVLSSISHIYRSKEFIDRSRRIPGKISNLNQYESGLQAFTNEASPNMVSWKQGAVFGVPANRVNDTHPNQSGLKYSYTTKELNDKYLNNFIIDIPAMEFKINAMQQEIEYKFRQI